MENFNLGQDVANEKERKWTAAHIDVRNAWLRFSYKDQPCYTSLGE